MSWIEIQNLLRQKIGIDANIIGSKIVKAVENRRSICGSINLNDYFQLLQNSKQEFDELVELIVVPETWFFRDGQPYNAIASYVRSQWLNKSHIGKLRLLSIPCSTGEEPYSLAMTLLDLGLLPNQFNIDAVDISKKSLAKAKKGIYGRHSFRRDNLEFQTRYFHPIDKEYQICDRVKNTVNFSQGNLLDPQLFLDRKAYDIIFCRNVLIYFDSLSRGITLKNLNSLLKTGGIILVGASETGELANLDWDVIRLNSVRVGRKKVTNTEHINFNSSSVNELNIKEYTKHLNQQNNFIKTPVQLLDKSQINNNKTIENQLLKPIEKYNYNLDTIRKLADEGNLTEAISQCQNYLQADSINAEVYVLLGQIYQAQRLELQAEECFKKAIYLDPKNSQALIHLSLLKEQGGDISKANILRQRLQRLQKS